MAIRIRHTRLSFVLGFIFLMLVVSTIAQTVPEFTPKTQSIVLFKNGLGYVQKEGTARLENGWTSTTTIPQSLLGTLWFGTLDQKGSISEVISRKEKVLTSFPCVSLDDFLKANIGKKCVLLHGDLTTEGSLVSVPGDNPISPNNYSSYNPSLIIRDDLNKIDTVIPRSQIKDAIFTDVATTFQKETEIRRLNIHLNGASNESRIGMSYLQKGISWMPSYLVQIKDSNTVLLTMKAMVINDTEDMDNTDLYFTVGFPHFQYSDILNPITMEQTLAQFISSLNSNNRSNESYGGLSNIMRQNYTAYAINGDHFGEGMMAPDYSTGTNLSGSSQEDLYLYQVKGISLQKGDRGEYPVFTSEVSYQPLYTWEVSNPLKIDIWGQRQEGDKLDKELVWHCLKLENGTDYPWTTAPAFTLSSAKPIAQDTLNYTPKGAKANLKLTLSSDIKAERKETETSRQRGVNINGSSYDLVTIQGELLVKNYKTQKVDIEITKNFVGESTTASDSGVITKKGDILNGINPTTQIIWNQSLNALESKTITYEYKVYVR